MATSTLSVEPAAAVHSAWFDVRVLISGPCATATAALMQAVAEGPVMAVDIVADVPGAPVIELGPHVGQVMGVASYTVGDARLLLFGTPGGDRGWDLTAALLDEVDAVVFVVDAGAAHTLTEAGVMLRSFVSDLRVPLVVAINHCDDPVTARTLAGSLGAPVGAAVVGCQLIEPCSGRDVVVEALDALLDHLGPHPSDRQVA